MKYKGYEAHIEFDEEGMLFHGEVIGLQDVITFQGTCVEELDREFHTSLDEYLKFCTEVGKLPEKPYSGKLPLRLSPDLHARIALQAKKEDTSINKWISKTLDHAIHS
jgi:predicted HicB family RNase H-like nuclease